MSDPNCKRCRDTGVWDTGNNDLPCPDCPLGDTAVFSVATPAGLKQMTGAETRTHYEENVSKHVFLVYTTAEEGHGGVYLWWKPNRSGYTRYIDEAGHYALSEVLEIVRLCGQEGAVPLDIVLENASRVLKVGALHEKLEPGVHGLPRGWKRS